MKRPILSNFVALKDKPSVTGLQRQIETLADPFDGPHPIFDNETVMETEISETEAARNFSDVLNRARYGAEEFIVTREGEPMCRIVPVGPRRFTIADLVRVWEAAPKPDPGYRDDLEDIVNNQPMEELKDTCRYLSPKLLAQRNPMLGLRSPGRAQLR